MPKIIPDLGPRILETAARHFETKGYEGTDMKSLAAELGISVGTLYNYHSGKPELFLAVSVLWKEKLSARMLGRSDQEDSAVSKLRAILWMLYEDMEAYTGIWKEFMQSGARFEPGSPVGQRFKKDNDQLNQRLQALFREVWKGRESAQPLLDAPGDRFAQLVVGSIMQQVMAMREDLEGDRAFLRSWIEFMVPEPTSPKDSSP